MSYSPTFTITSKLLRNVGSIDAAREVINHAPLIPAWERRFQSDARAKIIHHGTHLEGNALNLEEVEKVIDQSHTSSDLSAIRSETKDRSELSHPVTGRDRDIQEVINYRAVMDYLDDLKRKALDSPLPLTEAMLSEIHRLTVTRLMPESEAGLYRTVKVVIRNTTTGEITFRPPPPTEVPSLISHLFTWLNLTSEHPLLRAGILHYELARIHPFTDGNGRSARAAALLLLYLEGYEVKRFFSLEEYYDAHPSDYYEALKSVETAGGDLTSWLEYFCLGISIEFNRVKELVQKLSLDLKLKTTLGGKQIALTDRQIRLVEYLERHGSLSMKEGRDLLPDVSDDTVLRDLRDLCDKKLIKKKGNTKGAKYFLKNS